MNVICKRNRYVLCFALLVMLCACEHRDREMTDDIVKLEKCAIRLPLDSMISFPKGKRQSFQDSLMKLIVFSDSNVCASCKLKMMYKWNDFLDKMQQYEKGVMAYFIFSPSNKNMRTFHCIVKDILYSYPIYIDTMNVFLRSNPYIPSNPALHTFLLDENNDVILVGDPTTNPRIEELFWRTVKERLGEPGDSIRN